MTIIAEKLKAAGVKIPSMQERVWRIVKDNNSIPAARVADIFDPSGKAISGVSSLLSQMEARKMVTARVEQRRVPGPRGSFITRGIKVYTTTLREYELLPLPRKQTAATRAMDAVQQVVEQVKQGPVQTTVIPRPPTVNGAAAFVETMTIAEARALWVELNKMFGAKQ